MANKQAAPAAQSIPAAAADIKQRTLSSIEFPYHDLEDAEAIATGVHTVGGTSCTIEQLAGQLKQAANGGGFRLRLIASRMFGLVTYERGVVTLTELGSRICDPLLERAARVDAFLHVALYNKLYEQFKGKTLPPTLGLEQFIVNSGVSEKQKDKARQALQRSAKFAGFFEFGADRLILPSGQKPQTTPKGRTAPPPLEQLNQPASREQTFHPFIQGLLEKLPQPDAEWSVDDRQKWLQTAAGIFDLMYKSADGGSVVVECKRSVK